MNKSTYAQLQREVKKANDRLRRLRDAFEEETYAEEILHKSLDNSLVEGWTKSGNVRLRKSMTPEQQQAVRKRVRAFLNSETSTVRGARRVQERTIRGVKNFLQSSGEDEREVSINEANDIYRAWEAFQGSVLRDYIEPSDFYAILWATRTDVHAPRQLETFIHYVGQYVDMRRMSNDQLNEILGDARYIFEHGGNLRRKPAPIGYKMVTRGPSRGLLKEVYPKSFGTRETILDTDMTVMHEASRLRNPDNFVFVSMFEAQ